MPHLFKYSLIVHNDLISFPCINLMSLFIKLVVFYCCDSFFTMSIVILMTCSMSSLLDLWNTE